MMMFSRGIGPYFLILVPTPAPTVRPPSRIANRSPSSIAIGVISSIVIFGLSPGITISTPAANSTVPVPPPVRRENYGQYPLQNGLFRPPPPPPHRYTPARRVVGVVMYP